MKDEKLEITMRGFNMYKGVKTFCNKFSGIIWPRIDNSDLNELLREAKQVSIKI